MSGCGVKATGTPLQPHIDFLLPNGNTTNDTLLRSQRQQHGNA